MTDETKPKKGPLERGLSVFADVRNGEAGTALLLALGVFCLLAAYYVIKPVRDSLITGLPDGAKIKSYMGAAVAVALLGAVPAYGRFAASRPREKLLLGVGGFFVVNLLLFYGVQFIPAAQTGYGQYAFALGFFLWAGVFSMMIVAQFWAFANDLYTEEQGKRIFALIAIGQAVGSVVGSTVVSTLVREIGTREMFLISAALLGVSTAITVLVSSREAHAIERKRSEASETKDAPKVDAAKSTQGPFGLVFSNRYLLLIAFFTLVFTLVNTNGEYVKDELVKTLAEETGKAEGLTKAQIGDLRSSLFGQFYNWVNIATVILQSFVVSRIVKYVGMSRAFFIMPAIAFLDAAIIALLPLWGFVRVSKAAENAADYSLNNTLRNLLWLPTTREMKYLAKQAIDTFFVRAGDVGSTLCVFIFADWLNLGVRTFGFINLALIVIWLLLARAIVRENAKLSAQAEHRTTGKAES
jgi:ATP:ADP antiporter, AAA family